MSVKSVVSRLMELASDGRKGYIQDLEIDDIEAIEYAVDFMRDFEWKSLKEPPVLNDTVLLFHTKLAEDGDFPGNSVFVSNAEYARGGKAIDFGYTHWTNIPHPLPPHKDDSK